jgi:hypothetical protein
MLAEGESERVWPRQAPPLQSPGSWVDPKERRGMNWAQLQWALV